MRLGSRKQLKLKLFDADVALEFFFKETRDRLYQKKIDKACIYRQLNGITTKEYTVNHLQRIEFLCAETYHFLCGDDIIWEIQSIGLFNRKSTKILFSTTIHVDCNMNHFVIKVNVMGVFCLKWFLFSEQISTWFIQNLYGNRWNVEISPTFFRS